MVFKLLKMMKFTCLRSEEKLGKVVLMAGLMRNTLLENYSSEVVFMVVKANKFILLVLCLITGVYIGKSWLEANWHEVRQVSTTIVTYF